MSPISQRAHRRNTGTGGLTCALLLSVLALNGCATEKLTPDPFNYCDKINLAELGPKDVQDSLTASVSVGVPRLLRFVTLKEKKPHWNRLVFESADQRLTVDTVHVPKDGLHALVTLTRPIDPDERLEIKVACEAFVHGTYEKRVRIVTR